MGYERRKAACLSFNRGLAVASKIQQQEQDSRVGAGSGAGGEVVQAGFLEAAAHGVGGAVVVAVGNLAGVVHAEFTCLLHGGDEGLDHGLLGFGRFNLVRRGGCGCDGRRPWRGSTLTRTR